MTLSNVALQQKRRKIISAVFPTSNAATNQPTPVATPNPSYVEPGQSFGGPAVERASSQPQNLHLPRDVVAEQIKWNRAWHTATTFLILPQEPIPSPEALQTHAVRARWLKTPSREVGVAFAIIVSPSFHSATIPHDETAGDENLSEWYLREVRRHFTKFVRPALLPFLEGSQLENQLFELLQALRTAQTIYLHPLIDHVAPILSTLFDPVTNNQLYRDAIANATALTSNLRRDFHAIVSYLLPQDQVALLLHRFLTQETATIFLFPLQYDDRRTHLEIESDEDQPMPDVSQLETSWRQEFESFEDWAQIHAASSHRAFPESDAEPARSCNLAHRRIRLLFDNLRDVGLGGDKAERVFAEVMNTALTEHVQISYSDQWDSPSRVPTQLNQWIESRFAPLVVDVLHCLSEDSDEDKSAMARWKRWKELVRVEDVDNWQAMGVTRLGQMRVSQLFDIIVDWDASTGAIEDLKAYATNPMTRTYLVSTFIPAIMQRLLHPGASTKEIIRFYVSLIKAFSLLDPKGVLLDRVARPIRRYLREREDTVKVIVAGLLADPEDVDVDRVDAPDLLNELAVELNRASDHASRDDDDADLDWDDMLWTPDPVDAGPEYKKSRGLDVVGSLISLYDSKDCFVKELQNTMCERLLKRDCDFRVLELLKLRFGEGALQTCEVMVLDMRASLAIDRNVRSEQRLHLTPTQLSSPSRRTPVNPPPDIHAKILSRLFWPDLHDETFIVPPTISSLQARYERGFEALKQSRKLTWLNMLGHATVELDLADRLVRETVPPWQATVIYAFTDPHGGGNNNGETAGSSQPISRTLPELVESLGMEQNLVVNALAFWIQRRVLYESRSGVFTVLERLDEAKSPLQEASTSSSAGGGAANIGGGTTADVDSLTAAVKSPDQQAVQRLKMYWQFIIGMLTNAGAMPLAQIATMLSMAVPNSQIGDAAELQESLGEMVREGKIEYVGGKYRIAK
ncbi:MAG: hypothetical protein M1825_001746 [Sarcosagium campestre]|nr:MAG: hypothetical protein M1825_001746 [Sarcosagium campestre]